MPYIRCGGFVIGVAYQPLSRSSELRASPALASSVVVRLLFFSCRNTNIIDICFPIFTQLHDTKSEMIFFFWCDNELMFDTLRWKKKRRNRLDRFYNKKLCRSICQWVGNVMKKEVKLESLPAISYHSQWRNMQSSPNTLSTSSLMVFVKKKSIVGRMTMMKRGNDEKLVWSRLVCKSIFWKRLVHWKIVADHPAHFRESGLMASVKRTLLVLFWILHNSSMIYLNRFFL